MSLDLTLRNAEYQCACGCSHHVSHSVGSIARTACVHAGLQKFYNYTGGRRYYGYNYQWAYTSAPHQSVK